MADEIPEPHPDEKPFDASEGDSDLEDPDDAEDYLEAEIDDEVEALASDEDEPEQALSTQEAERPTPPADSRVHELMPEIIYQQRGSRLTIFPLAMGFIAVGVLLLAEDRVEGLTISPGAAAIMLTGALVLTYIFRFFHSGRRERGLFFLAVVSITWGAVIALTTLNEEAFPLEEFWPLTLTGIGVALFITFLFERSHQAGLVFPGLVLLFASGVSFTVSLDLIDDSVLGAIEDYWPLVLAFLGLMLLPAAFQDRS